MSEYNLCVPGRVRVFVGMSLDGFIAGPDDDLSWLPQPSGDPPPDYGFNSFIADVGALLMGRNTYEVAARFTGPWPYDERPVCVATHRQLDITRPSVHAVAGPIDKLVAHARDAAQGGDVYLDGGELIRQAIDARLIDTVTITLVPVVLGAGSPLFAGIVHRAKLELVGNQTLNGGLVQLSYRTRVEGVRWPTSTSSSSRRRRRQHKR